MSRSIGQVAGRLLPLVAAIGFTAAIVAGCAIEPGYGPSPIGADYYGDGPYAYGDVGNFDDWGPGFLVGPYGAGGHAYGGFRGGHAFRGPVGRTAIPSIAGGHRGGGRVGGAFHGGGGSHGGGGPRGR